MKPRDATNSERLPAAPVTVASTQMSSPSPGAGNGLLDDHAAAQYLGTTPSHVRRLFVERRLAGIRVGRFIRFARDDLEIFVAKQRIPARR